MAKVSQLAKMIAQIDAEIAAKQRMREWLIAANATPAPKPRREKAAKGKGKTIVTDRTGDMA